MLNEGSFLCPVCGYDALEEPAYDQDGCSSFEICPSCGTQFGYDDSSAAHAKLREEWINAGMKWWSTAHPAPIGWSAVRQLENVMPHH